MISLTISIYKKEQVYKQEHCLDIFTGHLLTSIMLS